MSEWKILNLKLKTQNLKLSSLRLRRSPDPPTRQQQGDIANDGHTGLQGNEPLEGSRIVEKVPGAGAHCTHQGRQHG